MLNYLTLSVKNQDIARDIAEERAERIDRYYYIILIGSLLPFFTQVFNLLTTKSYEIFLIINYGSYLAAVILLGFVRCKVKWGARVIFPIYYILGMIFEVFTASSQEG